MLKTFGEDGASGEGRLPDRLAGEDDATELLSDAEHWVAVYGEIVTAISSLSEAGEWARRRPRLLARLQARLWFWERRRWRLRSGRRR